ncbi:MAG: DUF3450 domain-containing protein [Methylococcaceae bacterium]|nr:DUF3450 domain-containing protein [Methylococcaceae bacterium]
MKTELSITAALWAFAAAPAPGAETLSAAIDNQVEANKAAAAAQQVIDAAGEQTRRMLDEYRESLRQTETLNAYNAHLRQLVATQETQKQSLEKQFGEIEGTRRGVVPLMLRMTEALDRFVQLDRPFLADARKQRMKELNALMGKADMPDAEKFRELLDAYKVENEYGKTIETYQADIQTDGKARTVDFLRIGRVALLYQSLDGRESGLWNGNTRKWQALPGNYNDAIRKGLAVARKEVPPELLTIAVDPPEAGR